MIMKVLRQCLFQYDFFGYVIVGMLLAEVILGCLIIQYVPYTEIDWKAYMEQVATFLQGNYDYIQLKGQTGPLVYPAGFVYIYSILYWLTDHGTNIMRAQYIFLAVYIMSQAVVLGIYYRTRIVPPWATVLLLLSKRIHSIYLLRCFNDTIAMFLLYLAVYAFLRQRWALGSLIYSLGVSIKMNLFLFAPAILFLMLQSSGVVKTIGYLTICATVQILLGLPFLLTHWKHYLLKAFEFNRVFTYQWTVNWKFLPHELFTSKYLALGLLICHLTVLFIALIKFYHKYCGLLNQITLRTALVPVPAQHIATTLFVANFVGICFSRTLHYQFYSWYFHTLPLLLWKTGYPITFRIALFIGIEYAFNVFPSTAESSGLLQLCHLLILVGILSFRAPKKEILSGLRAQDRQHLIQEMNTEGKEIVALYAEYFGKIPHLCAKGSRVLSIDEFELIISVPNLSTQIAIGFDNHAPLNSIQEAYRALEAMTQQVNRNTTKLRRRKDKINEELD